MSDEKVTEFAIKIDGATWPRVGKKSSELYHKLRFKPHTASEEDLLVAAEFIFAYRALINKKPATPRNEIINKLQAIEKAERVYE